MGSRSSETVWRRVGFAGVLLFAAAGFDWPEGALTGAILAVVALCGYQRELLPQALRSQWFRWTAVFSLWVAIRAVLRYFESPDEFKLTLEWTTNYIVAGGAPGLILALLLESNQRRMLAVLGVTLASLLIIVLDHFRAADIARYYYANERAFYGLGNAAGLYIATAILGLFLLLPWRDWKRGRGRGWSWLLLGCGCLALVLLIVALRWHQNRTVLFSLCVVFCLLSGYYFYQRRVRGSSYPAWRLASIIFVCQLAVIFALVGGEMRQRFVSSFELVATFSSLPDQELTDVTIRDRVKLWHIGWENVPEHWLAGAGPGSARELIRQQPALQQYPHLHNLYLQILFETGLIGLCLFGLVQFTLLRAVFLRGPATENLEWRLFVAGAMALFLLANLTQVRIAGTQAMFYLVLLYGVAMSTAADLTSARRFN